MREGGERERERGERERERERERVRERPEIERETERERDVVCWLLNVPTTCEWISGVDLLRQFYVLPS